MGTNPAILADALCDVASAPLDQKSGGFYGAFASELKRAGRFVLSPCARDAAIQVVHGRPSSILAAAHYARLPLDPTWIEFSPKDNSRGNPYGFPTPSRMGVLIEHLGARHQLAMSYAWQHGAGTPSISPFGFIFDLSQVIGRDIQPFPASERQQLREVNPNRFLRSSDSEADARLALGAGFTVGLVPGGNRFLAICRATMAPAVAERLSEELLQSIEGEQLYTLAFLILLNSQNCVERTKPDQSRDRQSRRGRRLPPPLSYSIVNIHLGRRDSRIASTAATEAETRAHLCRGHFKVRKTGIFWWRCHIRGSFDRGVVEHTAYRVEAANLAKETHHGR